MRKRGKGFVRRLNPNAGMHAIAMQHALADDQLRDLGMAVHICIERLRTGNGLEMDFHTLAAAVNVSLILCERGIGEEYLGDVITAQDSLIRMLERQRSTGRWAFDGTAYRTLTRAVELHEAQLACITRDSARAAMLEVRRRVDSGEVLNRVAA